MRLIKRILWSIVLLVILYILVGSLVWTFSDPIHFKPRGWRY